MSFQQTNLVTDPTWVGLDNFRFVLDDPLFPTAVQNTVYFALLALLFGYPVPLVGGGADERGAPARGLYSVLAYLPVVVPPVVAVLLWKFFYDARPDRRLQHDPRLGRTSARTPGCSRRRGRCRRWCSRRPGPPPAPR